MPFQDLNHLSFLQHAQMSTQIAIGQSAQFLEIVERQSLGTGYQRRQDAQPGTLVDDTVKSLIGKATFAGRRFRLHVHSPSKRRAEWLTPEVDLRRRKFPWPTAIARGCPPWRDNLD